MKFFIYSRKSVVSGKGDSLENQVQMCKNYVSAKFQDTQTLEFLVYEENGFSGKTTKRPMFQKMLLDLPKEMPDFLVCYRLDRISRSVSDFAWLIELLNQKGIAFLCIKEEFDTSKPMGKAMMYMASVFAQLERETIAERVRDNMRMLARGGRWLGGTPPLGFRSEKILEQSPEGKWKTVYALQKEGEEQAVVALIFRVFLETGHVSAVVKKLKETGIKTRLGKDYAQESIKLILENPVYAKGDQAVWQYFTEAESQVCFSLEESQTGYGLMAYNKRDYRKKNAPRQGQQHWIIALGRHEGIVSGAAWVEVQTLLSKGKKGEGRGRNTYALLSGYLFCKACGAVMTAKKRSDGSGFDYMCSTKRAKGKGACGMENVKGIVADRWAWEESGVGDQGEGLEVNRQKVRAVLGQVWWDGTSLIGEKGAVFFQKNERSHKGIV